MLSILRQELPLLVAGAAAAPLLGRVRAGEHHIDAVVNRRRQRWLRPDNWHNYLYLHTITTVGYIFCRRQLQAVSIVAAVNLGLSTHPSRADLHPSLLLLLLRRRRRLPRLRLPLPVSSSCRGAKRGRLWFSNTPSLKYARPRAFGGGARRQTNDRRRTQITSRT